MDRGTWQAAVFRVAQSWTQLKQLSMHAHMGHLKTPLWKDPLPNLLVLVGFNTSEAVR